MGATKEIDVFPTTYAMAHKVLRRLQDMRGFSQELNRMTAENLSAFMADIRELLTEDARILVQRITSCTYCAYCGAAYPVDGDAATEITEHIRTCEKHPMRALEQQLAELKVRQSALPNSIREALNSGDGTYRP